MIDRLLQNWVRNQVQRNQISFHVCGWKNNQLQLTLTCQIITLHTQTAHTNVTSVTLFVSMYTLHVIMFVTVRSLITAKPLSQHQCISCQAVDTELSRTILVLTSCCTHVVITLCKQISLRIYSQTSKH